MDGVRMKFFKNAIKGPRVFKEGLIHRGITRYLQGRGNSILLYVSAGVLGFDVAVAIHLLSGMLVLPLGAILCGSLLSCVFLCRLQISSPIKRARNPHEIDVADLLEREIVPMKIAEACAFLKGQVIVVTGAAGSIGSELCKQLLNCEPGLLVDLDTNKPGSLH